MEWVLWQDSWLKRWLLMWRNRARSWSQSLWRRVKMAGLPAGMEPSLWPSAVYMVCNDVKEISGSNMKFNYHIYLCIENVFLDMSDPNLSSVLKHFLFFHLNQVFLLFGPVWRRVQSLLAKVSQQRLSRRWLTSKFWYLHSRSLKCSNQWAIADCFPLCSESIWCL